MSLDFINGIYQYQANTSTSRNTTVSTTSSTTRSTSSTVDSTANTTVSTTASTSKSTTTTYNTTYTTTYNTSYTTTYSTSVPATRQPSSGWTYSNPNYMWSTFLTSLTISWGSVGNVVSLAPSSSHLTTYSSGGWTYYRGPSQGSDINMKTEIKPARSYLRAVNSIPVHTFKYKSNVEDEPILGVMAQEVEAVAPELMTNDTDNGFKAVYPQQIQYAMLKAIQELTDKVTKLEEKLK